MNKSFGQFYGDIVSLAKEAAGNSELAVGIIFEPGNEEMHEWLGSGAKTFTMRSDIVDEPEAISLTNAVLEEARDAAIKRHEEDLKLVNQGVYEHTDVGYSAIVPGKGITAVYYDICEPVGSAILGSQLGKAHSRLTVVMHSVDGDKATFAPQNKVCTYIRDFLYRSGKGTTTPSTGWAKA